MENNGLYYLEDWDNGIEDTPEEWEDIKQEYNKIALNSLEE